MDEEKLKKAAELLKDASDVLLSVSNNSNSNTTSPTKAPSSVTETLLRARSMMQTSSNSGLYRGLDRNERLRAATASTVSMKNKKSKSKPVEKKSFEFALLRANSEESDEEDEVETLRKEKIIERGLTFRADSKCNKCLKKGHWPKACKSPLKKKVGEVYSCPEVELEGEFFLSQLTEVDMIEGNSKETGKAEVKLNEHAVKFKVDTGADVTVIPPNNVPHFSTKAFTQ